MSILPPIQMRQQYGLAIADYGKTIELGQKNVPAYKKPASSRANPNRKKPI
jgi:hypothetical protein